MKFGAGRRGGLAAGLCSRGTSNSRLLCQLASFGALGSTGDTGGLAGPCLLRSGWELALFGRGRLCVRVVITRVLQSTCPSYCSGRNWVCFAQLPPVSAVHPVRPGIGVFGWGGANWVRLEQSVRTTVPPTPAPVAVRGGKLASFVPPGPTPASPATSPVRVRSCRSGRIGFVSRAFVRSTAFTRIGPVFPGNADLPIGIRKQPITTKPSKVVVSYLSSLILLLCHHTGVLIMSQIKSRLS